jgi:hypothetical protein
MKLKIPRWAEFKRRTLRKSGLFRALSGRCGTGNEKGRPEGRPFTKE